MPQLSGKNEKHQKLQQKQTTTPINLEEAILAAYQRTVNPTEAKSTGSTRTILQLCSKGMPFRVIFMSQVILPAMPNRKTIHCILPAKTVMLTKLAGSQSSRR